VTLTAWWPRAYVGPDDYDASGDAVADEDLGVQPGTAALFIYSSGAFAASGGLSEEIQRTRKGIPTRLLSSNLTGEQDARLQEVFGRS